MNSLQKPQKSIVHGTDSSTLADVLERILDKGMVIAGDIKINLVDIELLTIQIRLLICSVDKAKEMGIDWWTTNPYLKPDTGYNKPQVEELTERVAQLENLLRQSQVSTTKTGKVHS